MFISSGFKCLDLITGGFKEKNLIGIASAIGMGKTSLAINILLKSNIKGKKIYFSLEERKDCIEKRINDLGEIEKYKNSNIEIVDDDLFFNFEELRKKVCSDSSISMIIIDNISLISYSLAEDNSERKFDYTYLLDNLKILAVEKKIVIVFLKNLSREIYYRENKRPILYDVKDIELQCDILICIYRDEYYNASYVKDGNWGGFSYLPEYSKTLPKVGVELIVLKNRNECKVGTAHLFFNRETGNYFEK